MRLRSRIVIYHALMWVYLVEHGYVTGTVETRRDGKQYATMYLRHI
jgi:hypothetical protein